MLKLCQTNHLMSKHNHHQGDVLFIPKHYWHFVETVSDLSLSINVWLPVPVPTSVRAGSTSSDTSVRAVSTSSDTQSRFTEAATRYLKF
jgi:oxalate decarboxylase/phosphoglucose isomerase-like protein (cupin superfamily)